MTPDTNSILKVLKSTAFDSGEEYEFHAWCQEAGQAGIIAEFTYHPEPFRLSPRVTYRVTKQLKTKTREVDAFLMHPHEYTADFEIKLTDKGRRYLAEKGLLIWPPPGQTSSAAPAMSGWSMLEPMFIDVKGGFSKFHDAKQFSINQKWVFSCYGAYVYKAVPKEWFWKTWVPELALYTRKTHKLRDCYRGILTLKDIVW